MIPGSGRSAGKGIGYPLQYSWASLLAQLVKNPPAMQETCFGKILWKRERLTTPVFWPGEFHGLYSPWGHKELDRIEQFSLSPSLMYQFSSVANSCPTLCDPMNCSTPGLPVHHQLPEFTQTYDHQVGDAIQPSHPLSSPSPPAPNPSQHQSFPMSQLFA